MQCGYSLDVELNYASNDLSRLNLSKHIGIYVENTNTKSSFFDSSFKINKYYFNVLLRRPILDPKIPLMIGSSYLYILWILTKNPNRYCSV